MNNAILTTQYAKQKSVLMLLTNAFDPDPRVYQEAKSLVQNGYSVTIICWDREYKNPPFEKIDGIEVERIYVRSTHGRGIGQILFLSLFWIKSFFRIIARQFNIIHCHDFDTLPIGFFIARLKGNPVIYDAHESFIDMLSKSLPWWLLKVMVYVENILIKKIDLLITVGGILEKEFQRRGARETCVVGNWKKLEDYDIPKEKIDKVKKELDIPESKLIISFIGWFTKERKLSELLKAVSLSQNVHLLLGGDGPARELVDEALKDSLNVTWLGYVAPKQIPLYTSLADVIIYSFDNKNPNSCFSAPNKLFEALAAGRAIISGDFGEIGKIVREENCGVIVESITVDSLLEAFNFLSYNGVLNKYHKNAFNAARKKYNWERAEEVLLRNYKDIWDS